MIVCRRCGFSNAAEAAFCESCHAYLEWEGEPQSSAPEGPAPVPPRDAEGPGGRGPRPSAKGRAVAVSVSAPDAPVAPGGRATAEVRVRNTGQVVDAYAVEVVGEPAAWIRVEPHELRLFPGAEATARLEIGPPRGPVPRAGRIAVDVRVGSVEHVEVEQRAVVPVTIEPFVDLAAELVPATIHGRRSATGTLSVANRGNIEAPVALEAADPERVLSLELGTAALVVEPEATRAVEIRARAPGWHLVGSPQRYPFKVRLASPRGSPIALDAALVRPAWVGAGITTLLALGVVAAAAGFAVIRPWAAATPSPTPTATATATTAPASPAPPTLVPSIPVATDVPATPPASAPATDAPGPVVTEAPTAPPTARPTKRPSTPPPTRSPAPGTYMLGYNDVWLERSGSTGSLQVAATVVNVGSGAADGFAAGCSYTCPESPGQLHGIDICNGGFLDGDSSETYRVGFAWACAAPQPVFELSCVLVTPDLQELRYIFTVTTP